MSGRKKKVNDNEVAWSLIVDDIVTTYCHKLNDDNCFYKSDCPFAEVCKRDIEGGYKQEYAYRNAMLNLYYAV